MKDRLRELVFDLLATAVVAYLAVPPLLLTRQLRAAEYAELPLPLEWPYLVSIVLGAGGLIAAVAAFVRSVGSSDKSYRIAPMVAVTVAFVHYLVIGSFAQPGGATMKSMQALARFGQAIDQSGANLLPASRPELEFAMKNVGDPPYLLRGRPAERFDLVAQADCKGPSLDVGAHPPGTILYCVTSDRQRAWATVVGLDAPAGKPVIVFNPFSGGPAVLSIYGGSSTSDAASGGASSSQSTSPSTDSGQ